MSIYSALMIPRLSMPATGCSDEKEDLEQGVMGYKTRNEASETELQEAEKVQEETYIIESTDCTELYFFWPIPLIFDEFTVD
jgi:hypothetical protein